MQVAVAVEHKMLREVSQQVGLVEAVLVGVIAHSQTQLQAQQILVEVGAEEMLAQVLLETVVQEVAV